MAKNETKPLSDKVLKEDKDALAAIKKMDDYVAANDDFTLDKLEAADQTLKDADDTFAQAEDTWQAARDAHVKAQWDFHNIMLGGKKQVVAKYGDNSDQAQAVGLKKKSEYAKPARKNSAAAKPA
jgi:hypothetical protein